MEINIAHPLAIAGIRSTIAAPVLLLVLKKPRLTWSFEQLSAALSCSATAILFVSANNIATALEAILIPVLEPLLNPVWVFLTLHEAPGMWSLVGGLVVLTAVTVRCVMTILPGSMPNIKEEKYNEEV